jgi:hypothetical protein
LKITFDVARNLSCTIISINFSYIYTYFTSVFVFGFVYIGISYYACGLTLNGAIRCWGEKNKNGYTEEKEGPYTQGGDVYILYGESVCVCVCPPLPHTHTHTLHTHTHTTKKGKKNAHMYLWVHLIYICVCTCIFHNMSLLCVKWVLEIRLHVVFELVTPTLSAGV